MAIADAVPRDQAPDLLEACHPRGRETAEIVAPMMKVGLEVAGPTTEPRRDLRQHAPGEVFVALEPRVPRCEDGRAQDLTVAMGIPGERADVVGRDDPKPAGRTPV